VKVAIFIPVFPVITENFILSQLTELIDRGCEVDVFSHSRGDSLKIQPDVEKYGLLDRAHYWADGSRWHRAARYLGRAARSGFRDPVDLLRTLDPRFGRDGLGVTELYAAAPRLREDEYDVIHCHFGTAAVVPVLLRDCLGLSAKVITTFYGSDVTRFPRLRGAKCYAQLFSRGDHFLALSESMRARLIALGCPEHKLSIHHLGVRCDEISFRPRVLETGSPIRLVSAARLVEKKGLEYAIRAVAILREEKFDVQLEVFGDGPLRDSLKSLIDELGLRDRVALNGSATQPEVIRAIQQSHIFVLPSVTASDGDEEGTPTAIIEAMASGLPVVSTRHSGIPEQVEDGVSGSLVPERDAPGLAGAIGELIRKPARWATMVSAGRRRAEQAFDSRTLARDLLSLYRSENDHLGATAK
jgi:colanic acid/amylovoran biosynthesis glycosyltransferase